MKCKCVNTSFKITLELHTAVKEYDYGFVSTCFMQCGKDVLFVLKNMDRLHDL